MPRSKTPLAKLTKPNAAGLLHRQHLFDRLEAQPAGRLIWIAAPAGSGKTSLASSWIESRGLSHVWYQVDQGDSDPATLIDYLSRAARQGSRRKRTVLPRLAPERLPGLHVFVQRFFEGFFELIGGPSILVFDNFQELAPDSQAVEVIAGCLRALPNNTRVICISREGPPSAFVRWQVDPLFCEINYEALRLTNEEAHLLAGTDTAEGAAELNRLACGWAVGVRLLSHARRRETRPGLCQEFGPGDPLFDYLLREVFEQQEPGFRMFLLRSAVLPRLVPKVAAALTEYEQTSARLSWLHRHAFVTEVGSDRSAVYEYHPLLRQFLLKHAKKLLGAEEVRRLARQAAQLLTELGHIDEAFGLWAEGEDWARLSELIFAQAPVFAAAGRFATLAHWINVIPESLRRENGWISFWEGVCITLQNAPAGRECLARAVERFKASNDVNGQVLAIAMVITGYAMEWGHYASMDPWIRQLELSLPEMSSLSLNVQIEVLRCGQALLMRAPEHALVRHLATHAKHLIRGEIRFEQRLRISEFLILYLDWSGEWATAEIICREVGALCKKDRRPWSWVFFQLRECAVQRQVANHEAAFSIADNLLVAAREQGVFYLEAHVHGEAALSAVNAEDAERLERSIQSGRAAPGYGQGASEALFDTLDAALFSMTRRPDAAIACAERSLEKYRRVGNPLFEATACSAYGQMLMLGGRHELARKYLLECIAFGRRMPSKVCEFGPSLCLAWSHFQTGEAAIANTLLRQALELGARQSYMSYPCWNSNVMSDLCARALEADIEADYVCRLIRKRGLRPPSSEVKGWPYAIRLYTLGDFGLVIDDVPVRFGVKTPKKPLELLKAIVASGARAVSLEQVSEQVWPDLEADAGRKSLEIALYRLRKLLKYPETIIVADGKLSLDSNRVWVDAWAFQGLVQEQSAADPLNGESMSQQLLRLYRGHFLPEEESAWSISMRERLRSQWIRAIAKSGGMLETQQQWERGIDLYRRAIELDPLIEDHHRLLMRCYQAQGRIAESIETYRHCRELLLASLGVTPSPATEAAYQRLVKAARGGTSVGNIAYDA